MDKALDQSLTKHNIRIGFRAIGIWPLNLRVMDNKTQRSKPLHNNSKCKH